MRIPIPDDWNGQKWACYQIYWPDSTKWTAILQGLISYPQRGRLWDERTGVIKDVQALAWQIWARNALLACTQCQDCPDCPNCADCPTDQEIRETGRFGGAVMESENMGEVVTKVEVIGSKIRVYYGHCCFDEYEISGASSQGQNDVGSDPLNPTGDPNFIYSGCGKALAVVSAVYLTVQAGYSALLEPYPWQVLPYVEKTVGYDLDNNSLFGMLAEIGAGLLIPGPIGPIEFSDVNDAVEKQRILCRVVDVFADDAAGVPTSEVFEEIKGCFKAEMWPTSIWWGMFEYAINALGRNDLDTIAKLGAADVGANCNCVEENITDPTTDWDTEWSMFWDFRGAVMPVGTEIDLVNSNGEFVEHVPGLGAIAYPEEGGNGYQVCVIKIPFVGGLNASFIERAWAVFRTSENFDYSGVQFSVSIGDVTNVLTRLDTSDTSPSVGGTWTASVPPEHTEITSGTQGGMVIEGYSSIDPAVTSRDPRAAVLMALAFGGSGKNPFVAV